jgi:hypothetical protein
MHLSDLQLSHEFPQPPRLASKALCLSHRVRYLDSLSVCGKDKASRRLFSATRCRLLNHQPHSFTFLGGIRDKIYHLVLVAKEAISSFTSIIFGSDLGLLERHLQLVPQDLCVCRTIATEALQVLYGQNRSLLLLHIGSEATCTTDSYRGLKPEMLR